MTSFSHALDCCRDFQISYIKYSRSLIDIHLLVQQKSFNLACRSQSNCFRSPHCPFSKTGCDINWCTIEYDIRVFECYFNRYICEAIHSSRSFWRNEQSRENVEIIFQYLSSCKSVTLIKFLVFSADNPYVHRAHSFQFA